MTKRLLILVLAAAASGCSVLPKEDPGFYDRPMPPQPAYEPAADGTIYRSGTEVRLFEDLRAARVGDILTVVLTEQTQASNNSQTSTSKESSATIANPTVLGRPMTHNGDPIFGGSLEGENTFDGSGSTSQSNSLTGDITVTVVERLPNGNLVIQGEKWLTINQGREFIRVTGVIRPNDIALDNTISSTRIANAQLAYSAKGALADANRMGWLSRFFNSVWHPY
ncbi:MAG: flagellar basal body L-ring protein FlgH [Woeseiaceae bacterium]|nr:flagellar basal body L-ring protein FlgH [Woeseiaceae bacterium]